MVVNRTIFVSSSFFTEPILLCSVINVINYDPSSLLLWWESITMYNRSNPLSAVASLRQQASGIISAIATLSAYVKYQYSGSGVISESARPWQRRIPAGKGMEDKMLT